MCEFALNFRVLGMHRIWVIWRWNLSKICDFALESCVLRVHGKCAKSTRKQDRGWGEEGGETGLTHFAVVFGVW